MEAEIARRGSWQSDIRQYLAGVIGRGRTTVSVGELFELFAEQIPLEAAARKWAAGRVVRSWESPDHMRFYTLTQYLHWLGCSFTPHGQRKTLRTLVHLHVRQCPRCGASFVGEKQRKTCGCGGKQ